MNFYIISSQTSDWRASWIYYLSLRNKAFFYRGIRIFTVIFILLPVFFIIFLIQIFRIPILHSLFQTFLIFIFTNISLSITGIFKPYLPLSRPLGERNESILAVFFIAPVIMVILALSIHFIFTKQLFIISIPVLIILSILLLLIEEKRVTKKFSNFDFAG